MTMIIHSRITTLTVTGSHSDTYTHCTVVRWELLSLLR